MSASEASTLQPNTPVPVNQQSPNTSKVPLLGEGFQEMKRTSVPRSTDNSDIEQEGTTSQEGGKSGKRRLFGFGKKKDDDKAKGKKAESAPGMTNVGVAQTPIAAPIAQRVTSHNTSPARTSQYYSPNSPPQRNLFSSSPRLVSPAGSQIFERDVQESTLPPNSPAIPSHINTENHIPPVLDASSEAITNSQIDPDTVEIVMHSSHQPAAVTVTGFGSSELAGGTWADELVAHPDKDDAASNYGALDSTDIRRLSFISFSDIVQSEHAEHAGSRDSIYVAGLSSLSSGGMNRSPSPVRSPVSSQGFGTSPPTSKSASVKGFEISPRGKPLGSPISTHAPTNGGELTIETMAQALRRTGSGDLSGVRSQPLSPVSPDGLSDRSFRVLWDWFQWRSEQDGLLRSPCFCELGLSRYCAPPMFPPSTSPKPSTATATEHPGSRSLEILGPLLTSGKTCLRLMKRHHRMSILPAGMEGRPYNGTYGKDGALQDWQRNATETLARSLDRPPDIAPAQRRRPSMPHTIRTVTPEQYDVGGEDFQSGTGSARFGDNDASPSQTSPRSIPGGEKPSHRRQGLVFQDSYSTDSLDAGRPNKPPVSFHSRPRTRAKSGVEEHTRNRSTSTNVSKSRHRIGSVHSTTAPPFHGVERPAPDPSNSLGFPSISSRPTPPQIQKSNSVKSGRRLIKRSSRPTSPLSVMTDVPSVDSLPFPVATGDANKILMLMKTLCGRMRGEVEYQTYERGPWYPGICYIDDTKGSLMHEGDDSGPFHLTVIPDLRGCRVRPIVSTERQLRCLEISNRSLGLELHLLPLVKVEYDLWLAALLCWQQVRTGTLPASPPRTALQPVSDRASVSSKRNSIHNYPNSAGSSKDANIIKVAKVLLWDKGAPSSPRTIVRRPSTRDLKNPTRTWRRVSCILQDNGEFKLLTENDVTLLSVIQLSQLSRCAIQRLDRSVLDQDYCIAIFPRYTSTSTQLSIFRPVYIALESRLLYEVWFCLLIAFSIPEIYGPQSIDESNNYDMPGPSDTNATNDMFRIEKSINLRIVEAKIRRGLSSSKPETILHQRNSVKPEQDPSVGEYFAEVVLDGEVRARTMTRTETRNPFWREDYQFLDLPAHLPRLSIVLKKVGTPVSSHGFRSSTSFHGPDQVEESLCGTVEIPVEKLERGKDNEAWWPILDDLQEQVGEVFLKLRHDELVVLLAKEYEPISLLLHSFSSGLTDQIAHIVPSNLRNLSEILMNIFQVSGHASDWLMALVEEEIDGVGKETPARRLRWSRRIGSNESFNSVSDREQTVRDIGKSLQGEANLLFRGNSLFTQAMDFHMRRLGKEYLEDILAERIVEINALNADCEVDPSRLTHGEDPSKNWSLLISLTTEIWEGIAGSASRCPAELRQILKYIRAVAEDRYGDFFRTVAYTSVSGFLFLRFLCPALLNPKLFGLLKDHPQPKAQRTLTLVAKSLQALANLSSFGQKESWMEPMNRFLSSHRQGVKDYIDAICAISTERNPFALPASYSTPITILARLPPTSREGFPSLPYLIDHARNFAALIKLWLDATSEYILPQGLEGDLAHFNKLCLDLQSRANECLMMAETGERTADQLSLQWEELVEGLETTTLDTTTHVNPNHRHDSEPSMHSPPMFTTTITAAAPGSAGSEMGSKEHEKRERQSFWESTFGRESKYQRPYETLEASHASPPSRGQSRNGNSKQSRSFLSGLRRKGKNEMGASMSSNTTAEQDSGVGGTLNGPWSPGIGGDMI
ncbi:hypothetical protein G7Y89_g4520 [Cudoniella acicularis]|uniref:Ras-GAP domain-containing protein n=1 Tax=Cudoniella acicularis TaxID=354080 RepID=A0A8H4RRF3_9HELO|nr:hypothetical protein G7Y89_g4520 [Cudoniella acicularis]